MRNSYETAIGRFDASVAGVRTLDPATRTFGDFPAWLRKGLAPRDEKETVKRDVDDDGDLREQLQGAEVYMYCTGGVRCERASALLRGVLCAGSLARVSVRRREDRADPIRSNPSSDTSDTSDTSDENKNNSAWISARSVSRGVDAPARVVALRGVELDDPFFGNDGANATFAYANGDGQAEARRKRIFNADGHFAKDISRDVGQAGRRAIHGHGPLLWHL